MYDQSLTKEMSPKFELQLRTERCQPAMGLVLKHWHIICRTSKHRKGRLEVQHKIWCTMRFIDRALIKLMCVMVFLTSCRLEKLYVGHNQEGSEVTGSDGSSCSFLVEKKNRADVKPSSALFSLETTQFGTEIEFPLSPMGRCRFWKYQENLLSRCRLCAGDISCQAPTTPSGPIKVTSKGQELLIFVGLDPGVLEIRTQPMAYHQHEGWAGVMDNLVFGAAKDMGDFIEDPDVERNRWSGHINVSWPGLVHENNRSSMALLLNYVVDANNHPGLAMGVLGGDTRNAPPLMLGNDLDRIKLGTVIEQFKLNAYQSQSKLAEDIFQAHASGFRDKFLGLRYNLVNVDHLRDDALNWEGFSGKRVEARGFFTPRNSKEILTYYRIINHRLKYLYETYVTKDKVLEFMAKRFYDSAFHSRGVQPPLTAADGAKTFVSYLREMGLDPWQEGQNLRDPEVRDALAGLRNSATK